MAYADADASKRETIGEPQWAKRVTCLVRTAADLRPPIQARYPHALPAQRVRKPSKSEAIQFRWAQRIPNLAKHRSGGGYCSSNILAATSMRHSRSITITIRWCCKTVLDAAARARFASTMGQALSPERNALPAAATESREKSNLASATILLREM